MLLASEFGTGQVFWSMLWFFLFFIWIIILFQVFFDIFRSKDMGGWGKALWLIFVIITPFLGVFVYLIARGSKMQEHAISDAKAQNEATQALHPPGRRHRHQRRRPARQARRSPHEWQDRRRRVRRRQGQDPRLSRGRSTNLRGTR